MYYLEFQTRLSDAIALQEGYLVEKGTKLVVNPLTPPCVTAKNPGALRWPNLPTLNNMAVFSSITAGWVALAQQIRVNIWGRDNDPYPLRSQYPMNLREFFGGQRDRKGKLLAGGYPGFCAKPRISSQDAVTAYVENVAKRLHINPKTPLRGLVK